MDVEGAEMLALIGMNRTLKSNRDIKMFIEFFPLLIEKMGNSPKEFIHKLLEYYRFSIFVIPDDYSARQGKMMEIENIQNLMDICKREKDHVNLFLTKP
jgi:hypothetical protein